MKKLTLCLTTMFLSLTFIPIPLEAETNPTKAVTAKTIEAEKAKTLLGRLKEIDGLDKSKLKSAEKRILRKEVRSIKKELKAIGSGVYLSGGAILLIVILLIIFL